MPSLAKIMRAACTGPLYSLELDCARVLTMSASSNHTRPDHPPMHREHSKHTSRTLLPIGKMAVVPTTPAAPPTTSLCINGRFFSLGGCCCSEIAGACAAAAMALGAGALGASGGVAGCSQLRQLHLATGYCLVAARVAVASPVAKWREY